MTQIMVPTVDILTGLAIAVVVVVGGQAVLGGRMDVGVMVTFILYVQRFFEPVRLLSMQYTIMQRAMAAGHRIFEVIDVPVTIADKPGAIDLKDAPATVEFRNVTFGYDPARPILHDINLIVRPKEVVALVGPTGSGKTSIIALTHRFYEVDRARSWWAVMMSATSAWTAWAGPSAWSCRSPSCSLAPSSRTSATIPTRPASGS